MSADWNFEDQVFALYGEPSGAFESSDVTARVLREIQRENRVRTMTLAAGVVAGVGLAAFMLAVFAGSLIARAASLSGVSPLIVWTAVLAGAAFLGAAMTRVTLEA